MSQDDFAQNMVNEAIDAIHHIFTNRIMAPTPICERTQAWMAGIQEMREELEFVRSVMQDGVAIPLFLISLDMHLVMLQPGRWPPWSAIRDSDMTLNPAHPWLRMHRAAPPAISAATDSALSQTAKAAAPPSTNIESPSFPVSNTGTTTVSTHTNIANATADKGKGKGKAKEEDNERADPEGPNLHQTRRRAQPVVPRVESGLAKESVEKKKGKEKEKRKDVHGSHKAKGKGVAPMHGQDVQPDLEHDEGEESRGCSHQ